MRASLISPSSWERPKFNGTSESWESTNPQASTDRNKVAAAI
ncbi:hypothetical protein [Pseudactinotalea sp. HY160]|nr:hypothetical protein [Pseudactinotalea sp. HY160]